MLSSHRLLLLLVAVQGGPLPLTCPKGVTSFSATSKPGHFYSCGADGVATLSDCPVGKVYHGFSEKCRNTEEKDRPKPIDEKSLGRNVVLGALFDARKNEYYNGLSPWTHTTVNRNKFKYDRKETTTSFASDTRSKDKADHFDISANLALDFMSGQVHVEGGMNYLSDEVSSEREIHVEMMYHTTKYTETMPKYIEKDYLEECNNPDITHVVTSVTYGMDANFVFKYLMSDYESKENIYGMLKLTVTAVPGLAIEGSGSVNMTSEQTEMMARTDIEVFGHYAGGPQVTDFESALELYRVLPSLSGTAPDYSGASILEVHLTPIVDICTDADFILNAINDGLVNSVTNMLSELELVGVKARGLKLRGAPQPEKPLAVQFKPLGENLDLYLKERTSYENSVKSDLQKIIPNIRGGNGTGEEDLVRILGEYEASPFAFETSNQFLIRRNREISAVWYLTQSFPENNDGTRNIQIMDFDSANDVNTFLSKNAVLLMELHILSPRNLTQNFVDGNPEEEDNFWFNDVEMNGHIGSLLRNMSKFAWENVDSEDNGYLVKLLEIEEDGIPNIKMEGWLDGEPKDPEFVVPPAPAQASVYQVSHDSVKLKVKVFNKFTTGAKIIITNAFDVTQGPPEKTIIFPENLQPGDEMEITFSGLDAITLYTVSVQYLTNYGLSPPSPASPRFLTAPSSPPSQLEITATTIDSLTVAWAQPEEMGVVEEADINPADLSYSIMIQGEKGYSETKVFAGPPFETIFSGLQDASHYKIEARAFYQEKTSEEEPATALREDYVETTTSATTTTTPAPHRLAIPVNMISTSLPASCGSYSNPTTPTMLPSLPGEVGLDSAIVMWEGPSRVPENATEPYFTLAYAVAYGGGNGTYGDFIEVNVEGANKATVDGLVKNTLYVFKVKLVTNEGNSDFSSLLAVKTLDDETDLGKFEDEVMDRLDDLRKEAHKKSVFCASQDAWDTNSGDKTVTYDQVFLSSVTNMVGAELDPGTGVFKAGAGGSYMVSASMEMMIDSDQTHNVYVQKNGETLADSKMSAHCDVNNFYCFSDNGAKDIVVALEAGDTLNLLTKKSEGLDIANIVFCVQSLKVQ